MTTLPPSIDVSTSTDYGSNTSSPITTNYLDDVILAIGYFDPPNGATPSISSSPSLTWIPQYMPLAYNNCFSAWIWYAAPGTTVSNLTVTITQSGSSLAGVAVIAVHGANRISPFDSNGSLPAGSSSGSTATVPATFSTTNAYDLAIGVGITCNSGGPNTWTNGWVVPISETFWSVAWNQYTSTQINTTESYTGGDSNAAINVIAISAIVTNQQLSQSASLLPIRTTKTLSQKGRLKVTTTRQFTDFASAILCYYQNIVQSAHLKTTSEETLSQSGLLIIRSTATLDSSTRLKTSTTRTLSQFMVFRPHTYKPIKQRALLKEITTKQLHQSTFLFISTTTTLSQSARLKRRGNEALQQRSFLMLITKWEQSWSRATLIVITQNTLLGSASLKLRRTLNLSQKAIIKMTSQTTMPQISLMKQKTKTPLIQTSILTGTAQQTLKQRVILSTASTNILSQTSMLRVISYKHLTQRTWLMVISTGTLNGGTCIKGTTTNTLTQATIVLGTHYQRLNQQAILFVITQQQLSSIVLLTYRPIQLLHQFATLREAVLKTLKQTTILYVVRAQTLKQSVRLSKKHGYIVETTMSRKYETSIWIVREA